VTGYIYKCIQCCVGVEMLVPRSARSVSRVMPPSWSARSAVGGRRTASVNSVFLRCLCASSPLSSSLLSSLSSSLSSSSGQRTPAALGFATSSVINSADAIRGRVERLANVIHRQGDIVTTTMAEIRTAHAHGTGVSAGDGSILKVVGQLVTAYVLPEGEKWPTFLTAKQSNAVCPHIYLHRHDVTNAGRCAHTIR
jgi:hypothetical protein